MTEAMDVILAAALAMQAVVLIVAADAITAEEGREEIPIFLNIEAGLVCLVAIALTIAYGVQQHLSAWN